MPLSLKKQNKEAAPAKAVAPRKERAPKADKKPRKPKKEKGGGGKRFVFIVGDEGCILVFMHGHKVLRRLFAPSAQPSHTGAMHEIMRANPSVPIYLLADVLDQQYIPHPFPPVSALSIGGLVKRRLDRDFQPEDLKGALPLGRDKTGRKEWKYLLIALAKTPLITEWLDLIVELSNEMKGVYLVPVEAVSYIGALNKALGGDKPKPWQLFISHNKISGFRQIVIHEGKLVFTRVSQAIDDAIPAVIAGNVEQEIINTIEYLKRLDFKENGELDTTVIISQDVIDSLDLNRFGFARAQALTPMDVAEALDLEQAALSADRFGDVVMASAFGISKKRVLRFSTPYIDKLAKIYQARLGIRAVAALAVLALLGMSVMSVVGIVTNLSAMKEVEQSASRIAPDLDRLRKSVVGLNENVAFQSAVVAAYDTYIKDQPRPEDSARALMQFVTPKTRITSISWKNVATSGGVNPSGQSPAPAPGAEPMKEEIKIKVDFTGSGETVDELSNAAQQFQNELSTKTAYEVTNDPYPWVTAQRSTSSGFDLTASTAVQPQDRVATFTLKGPKKMPPGATPQAGQVQP